MKCKCMTCNSKWSSVVPPWRCPVCGDLLVVPERTEAPKPKESSRLEFDMIPLDHKGREKPEMFSMAVIRGIPGHGSVCQELSLERDADNNQVWAIHVFWHDRGFSRHGVFDAFSGEYLSDI